MIKKCVLSTCSSKAISVILELEGNLAWESNYIIARYSSTNGEFSCIPMPKEFFNLHGKDEVQFDWIKEIKGKFDVKNFVKNVHMSILIGTECVN